MSPQLEIANHLHLVLDRLIGDPANLPAFCENPQAILIQIGVDANLWQTKLPIPAPALVATWQSATQVVEFGPPLDDFKPPVEAQLALHNSKEMCLLTGSERSMRDVGAWLVARGGVALLYSTPFMLLKAVGKGGHSDLLKFVGDENLPDGAERTWRLLGGTNPSRIVLGWLASTFNWHELLGVALGYPHCCVRAFAERWPSAQQRHQGDLSMLSLQASAGFSFDWRMNIFSRYFGLRLLQHFPCTFSCRESLKQAEALSSFLDATEPTYHRALSTLLRSQVLYTENQGVALILDGELRVTSQDWEILLNRTGIRVTSDTPFTRSIYQTERVSGEKQGDKLIFSCGGEQGVMADFKKDLLT